MPNYVIVITVFLFIFYFSNRVVVQPWHSLHTLTLSHNKITHLDDSLQILPALREVREGRREGERERGREGRIERERRKGGIEGERVRERRREGGRREGGGSEEEKGYFDEEKEPESTSSNYIHVTH